MISSEVSHPEDTCSGGETLKKSKTRRVRKLRTTSHNVASTDPPTPGSSDAALNSDSVANADGDANEAMEKKLLDSVIEKKAKQRNRRQNHFPGRRQQLLVANPVQSSFYASGKSSPESPQSSASDEPLEAGDTSNIQQKAKSGRTSPKSKRQNKIGNCSKSPGRKVSDDRTRKSSNNNHKTTDKKIILKDKSVQKTKADAQEKPKDQVVGGGFGIGQKYNSPKMNITPQQFAAQSSNQQRNYQNKNSYQKKIFGDYMEKEKVETGLKDGSLYKAVIRVNPRNYQECFLDHPRGTSYSDILVLNNDRNRALNGDIVAVRMKPRDQWIINEPEYEKWLKTRGSAKRKEREIEGNNEVKPIENVADALIRTSISEKTPEKTETEDNTVVNTPVADISKSAKQALNTAKNTNNSPAQKKTLAQTIKSNSELGSDSIPDDLLIITAEVVSIEEKKHGRIAAGKLTPMQTSSEYALFIPNDPRIPRIMIPKEDLDEEFFRRPADFEKFIYMAKITRWRIDSIYADGRLEKQIGEKGDISAETEAILRCNQIDYDDFSQESIDCLPISSAEQWSIPDSEREYRRDFTKDMVFTIDPKTARDLDDALSLKPIDDIDGSGTPGWEVGVHIADVTYFVPDDSVLDDVAESRANSTYLAQMVVPMLPRILSEQLCSLNPGVERLCFSFVCTMNDQGQVFDKWFGRTIIRSCVKLAYEHAQDFIEHPDKEFDASELPEISGDYSVEQIKQQILSLHRIAQVLRAGRIKNGALRIEQPRLKFSVDPVTKQPLGVSVYQLKDSNKLVEEFMLLANISVAEKIEKHFPLNAFLRRHPPPKEKMMHSVMELCAKIGFPLDGTSSHALSSALRKFTDNSLLQICIRQVLSQLTIKPMQQALYFCTNSVECIRTEYKHYALCFDLYTHFTSPIRRYADMIVHRQLAAALGYSEPPKKSTEKLDQIARNCNDRKMASKQASEQSDEVFFGIFVNNVGVIRSRGVVVQVFDKAFGVLVVQYGVIKRVYCDKLNLAEKVYDKEDEALTLVWPADDTAEQDNRESFTQVLRMCSVVDVELHPLGGGDRCAYAARILRPTLEQRKKCSKTLSKMYESGDQLEELNVVDVEPEVARMG